MIGGINGTQLEYSRYSNDVLDNQIQKTNKADLDGLLDSIETSQGECSLVAAVY